MATPFTITAEQREVAQRVYDFLTEHPERHYQRSEMGAVIPGCGTAGCINGWLATEIACDGVAWQQHWTASDYEALLAAWTQEHDDADMFSDRGEVDAPDVVAYYFQLSGWEYEVLLRMVYTEFNPAKSLANFAELFGLDTSRDRAKSGAGRS